MMRDAIVLIAIVLIGLMLVGPSLMAGFSDLMEDLSDWVKYGWDFEDGISDDTGNGDGDDTGQDGNGENQTENQNSEGQLCMGVTVQFKDGTQHTVGPEEIVFTLFPMTIYFEGKEVSSIWWHCNVLVDWIGDITSFKVTGNMKVTTEGITLRSENILKSYTSVDLPKNQWFEVWKFGLDALDIEFSLGSGDYTLLGETTLQAEVIFSDAHTESSEATGSANLPIFIEEGTLTVFSVEIQPQILNP